MGINILRRNTHDSFTCRDFNAECDRRNEWTCFVCKGAEGSIECGYHQSHVQEQNERNLLRFEEASKRTDQEFNALGKQRLAISKNFAVFVKAFEKQWMTDNKPHGFDVQDIRLGGIIHRTDACRRRILDYVNGKIDRIEELDEKLVPFGEPETSMTINRSNLYSTVNVMAHMV